MARQSTARSLCGGFASVNESLQEGDVLVVVMWMNEASKVVNCAKAPVVVSGGGGADGLDLQDGVTGDGVGSIQNQQENSRMESLMEWKALRLVLCPQFEAFTHRCRVTG